MKVWYKPPLFTVALDITDANRLNIAIISVRLCGDMSKTTKYPSRLMS